MAAADEYLDPEVVVLKKKPAGNVPTNIVLLPDAARQRIILPREGFLSNPDFYILREESFIKECLQAAFGKPSERA